MTLHVAPDQNQDPGPEFEPTLKLRTDLAAVPVAVPAALREPLEAAARAFQDFLLRHPGGPNVDAWQNSFPRLPGTRPALSRPALP